ncbi:MAG TPA: response regulator [Candidatus Limnocylindrales bacterium]|nr:response regulator [Candidatus Limnocylindrales bacterium]
MDKTKIILIEDDKLIREIYTFTLQKANYEVLPAADGDEGILLAQGNPDAKLIFLDVIMPNSNGVQVLQKLKSDPQLKNIPVILLSNLTDDKIVDEAMALGAYGYLVKAEISPTDLVDKTKEILSFHDKKTE